MKAMETLAKIPTTILTGFLGAGKTTLLRHVLEQANGRRIALIINEFGDVGIDAEILKGCGLESCTDESVVELANGCLCCTVADDFVPAIDALLSFDNKPDHIIVETSGLALPKPLVKAFTWPQVRARLTVDGVIAVVDGPAVFEGRFAPSPAALVEQGARDASLDHDNPLEEVYEDQLLCADLVVMTKTDLLTGPQISSVCAEIQKKVPRAVQVIKAACGKIDPDLLLGLDARAEADLAARPSHHDHGYDADPDADPDADSDSGHDHDAFATFVVSCGALASPLEAVNALKSITEAHGILRIKGFLPIAGKAMRLVIQGVGSRFDSHFDRAWKPSEARAGRLVVIGQKGLNARAIEASIKALSRDAA